MRRKTKNLVQAGKVKPGSGISVGGGKKLPVGMWKKPRPNQNVIKREKKKATKVPAAKESDKKNSRWRRRTSRQSGEAAEKGGEAVELDYRIEDQGCPE